MSRKNNIEFGIDPELRQSILTMRLTKQNLYDAKLASVQRVFAIKKGMDQQAQYLYEKYSQDFAGQYCVLAIPVMVKLIDANTDKVTDAANYLTNHFKRLEGLQLGRMNDAYIVETGEAVVTDMKW